MAKKRKARRTILRFRKNDPSHNLLAATQAWVRANGGDLVLIGGIGIMPDIRESTFKVVVGCMGRKPEVSTTR